MNNLFDFDKNFKKALGTDEAGRGPGAGGVFAAAVYFPNICDELQEKLEKLNDSKKLSKSTREALFEIIIENSVYSIVNIEVEEIEKYNNLNSSLKGMKKACENVIKKSDLKDFITLVDGNRAIKNYPYSQKCIVKGDGKSASIAAASILAKVSRDRYMENLAKEFPQYGWDKNAGYLTKEHLNAIDKYGVTKYHRLSFLKKHFEKQLSLF